MILTKLSLMEVFFLGLRLLWAPLLHSPVPLSIIMSPESVGSTGCGLNQRQSLVVSLVKVVWPNNQCILILDCEESQFACESEGGRCLDQSYMCDGIPDCIGSDFPFVSFDELQCPLIGT